jgi:hypothetical protein
MVKHKVYVVCLILFVSALSIEAQTTGRGVSKSGTAAAPFLQIPVGARAIGMGGAFVGTANDVTGLYWNPAGIARLNLREVIFSHMEWLAEVNFDYGAVAIPLGGFGSIGISFTSLSMDDMLVRTVERPEGTGELFSAGSIAIGVHYARNLTDNFSIGISAKYISEQIWDMSAQGFAVDFGTLFTTNFLNGMRIGAALTNFGTDMKMSGRNARMFYRIDPDKQGSNERIPHTIELDSWPLPLNFQFGIATDLVRTESHLITVAVDALHPSNDYQSVNVGGEYGFLGIFFVRAGYNSLFLDDGEGGVSFGTGIHSDLFGRNVKGKVDYAYRDYGRLKGVHAINVSVMF